MGFVTLLFVNAKIYSSNDRATAPINCYSAQTGVEIILCPRWFALHSEEY